MTNFDDMRLAVEALSGGKNTVRLDDLGMPSVLVPFPRLNYADVITGGTQEALPAFIVDGQTKEVIFASKYQNIIVNDRAYSLPMKDPAHSLNFDRALDVCRNKGAGWHLLTNALWAAIALWCKKNGTMPRGNNSYGKDHANPHEKGIQSGPLDTSNRITRTATGSGPVSWYHNYADSGIADLNGNVWEWCSGLRLKNGEIQIIPYGNAMKHDCNMNDTSTEWRAILQDGTLVAPSTANTLKINGDVAGNANTTSHRVGNPVIDVTRSRPAYTGGEVNDHYGSLDRSFETLAAAAGVTVPMLLVALGISPRNGETGYESDHFWARNYGERLPIRGGNWNNAGNAGVFALNLHSHRALVGTHIGFRAAFFE